MPTCTLYPTEQLLTEQPVPGTVATLNLVRSRRVPYYDYQYYSTVVNFPTCPCLLSWASTVPGTGTQYIPQIHQWRATATWVSRKLQRWLRIRHFAQVENSIEQPNKKKTTPKLVLLFYKINNFDNIILLKEKHNQS